MGSLYSFFHRTFHFGITPNDPESITACLVAPSLRRLRSGASLNSHDCQYELLSHYYGTRKKNPLSGGAEGVLSDSPPVSRTPAERSQSRRNRRHRETRQQLSPGQSLVTVPRPATLHLDSHDAVPTNRAGNRTRQSVGEEEAGVVSRSACGRGITGSGRERRSQTLFRGQQKIWTSGVGLPALHQASWGQSL